MISITLHYQNKNDISGFKVNGHANFKKHGDDIVCAAISVLAQTIVLTLEKYFPDFLVYKLQDGFLECNLSLSELDNMEYKTAQVIFDTFIIGIQSIKKEYNKYIKIL